MLTSSNPLLPSKPAVLHSYHPSRNHYILGNASCSQNVCSHFLCPLTPPPPPSQPASDGFPLELLLKGPQNRIANTQPKLRINPPQIANKQNDEQMGVSDILNSRNIFRAKIGSSQTWLFQTWLFAIFTWKRSFALFCALWRPFADLRLACFCIRPRLERPRLATAEQKSVRAIDARNSQLENGSNAAKNQCSRSRAALLRTCVCALLRAFACFCIRPRLERPRLGTAEQKSVRAIDARIRS